MNSARVLRGLVLGAIGGFLGWFLVEHLLPGVAGIFLQAFGGGLPAPVHEFFAAISQLTDDRRRATSSAGIAVLGATIGLMDGLALGVGEGITAGTQPKFMRALGAGAATGLLGGVLGLWVGQRVYEALLSIFGVSPDGPGGPLDFFVRLIARTVGWGLIGTFVGCAIGVPSGSTQKIRNGFIGGTIGGLVGGFAFEIFAQITQTGGQVPRLIGFTSIGAAVGFFVSLVDEALKSAWVKVLVGRNEGREVVIDKPSARVGRDELADIPIFGDPSVSHHHATIYRQDGRYLIADQGTATGTVVNGQRVSQQYLQDGDEIQLGGVRMIFYEKATAGPERQPVDAPRSPVAPLPSVPANICAFCGQEKDPLTGACACSVGDPAPLAADAFGSAPPAWPSTAGTSADAGAGTPRLVAVAGPYAGQVFPLAADGASIGREPARDVALTADAMVSRRHASIAPEGGGFVLRDDGSSNGTFVNGQRVQQHLLRPGDEIRIGASALRYEI